MPVHRVLHSKEYYEYLKKGIIRPEVVSVKLPQFNNKNKYMIIKVLKFLQGKKNILAGVITTTSAFLALKGVITPEDATYINAISLLLFGSASIATGRMLYNK